MSHERASDGSLIAEERPLLEQAPWDDVSDVATHNAQCFVEPGAPSQDNLASDAQMICRDEPGANLLLADLRAERSGSVPSQRLIERYVEVEHVPGSSVLVEKAWSMAP
jgi:hypothetical protein